ncbi:MAG: alpha/beta hydrolase [Pseudomonadota bacterium]
MDFNELSLSKININGAELYYVEKGSGEPLIFVHGAISDLRTWENQIETLSRHFKVISYSRRFARPNKDIGPGAGDPWETHVEDLAALIEETDSAPANLIGNSQGGYICLLTALKYPQLVKSLTIEEAPVVPLFTGSPPSFAELLKNFFGHPFDTFHVMKFGLWTVPKVKKAFRDDETERALEIFGRAVLGDRWYESLSNQRYEQIVANHSSLKAFWFHNEFPAITTNELKTLQIQVLLLTGTNSPEFLLALSRKLAAVLPNVTTKVIENASHLIHENNAPGVNDTVHAFLSG